MRALVVELLEEGIEARLPLYKVLSGGLGGLFLEREMHGAHDARCAVAGQA